MLRLVEVAIIRGELAPDDVPTLKRQLADEFPSGEPRMNRELIRLLVYLQESSIIDRYLAYLKSDAPDADRLHAALHLRFLEQGWTPAQRLEILSFYEDANKRKGGGSYARYIINVTRDFCQQLSEEESRLVLEQGEKWPNAALGALYRLPKEIDPQLNETLAALDGKLTGMKGDSIQRLQVGILAVMARSGDEASMTYLRKVWEDWPERRQSAALGLAQQPDGPNWTYLVRTMPVLEPAAAREICARLTHVSQAPDEPDPYRQAILLGLKMRQKDPEREDAAANAIGLLQFWTGEELASGESEDKQLAAWQAWFAKTYPGEQEAALPVVAENAKYTVQELADHLAGEQGEGLASRGANVFVKAQCARCHRFDGKGETLGPDLTTIAARFTRKELIESIVHPSHIISSQYASKTLLTTDGRQITGLVLQGAGGETIVLQPNGEQVALTARQIESAKPSKLSAMPDGLLDTLTLEEVADLFAYLQRSSKAPQVTRRPGENATK
jgi:putative heme-binding domain-containing protein